MGHDELATTASSAPAVRRMGALVAWVDAGRPLTQTGRIRRADALGLVESLDTGDVLDSRFPIHSSAELHWLGLWVEWAKAARLVRVLHRRLVPVATNAGLLGRPLELVAAMLDALPRLGAAFGDSVVAADAGHTVEAVLGELTARGGGMALARADEVAWQTAMSRYWFPDASEQQIEWQRRFAQRDTRGMLDAVADLGLLTVSGGTVAPTALGERCLRAWLGLGTPASPALTVSVTLCESTDPLVWRRLRVPADIRLDRFHQTLGAAMGWQDSHLHVFERGEERYGSADLEPELDIRDERQVTIGDLLTHEGDRLDYEYDFGDSWSHDVRLEAVEPSGPDEPGPRCTDGAGRCPPEDVGGIPGYQHLREVLAAPDDPGGAELLVWMGLTDADDFDPARFDLERANTAIADVLAAHVP
jgi:hypothetical protein